MFPGTHTVRRAVTASAATLAVCCAVAFAALAVAAASAAASSSIEGVWSFNGGSVAIQPEAGGKFTGTVLKTTQFAECPHQVGEQMWSDITERPDGSYWGLHQWFYAESGCKLNPNLGPTAWRVLPAGTSHFLRVCLTEPGEDAVQPTIAPTGVSSGEPFTCVDSSLIGPLPENKPSEFFDSGGGAGAVDAAACLPANKIRIRIKAPKTNPLKEIHVALKGGGIRRVVRIKPRPKTFIAVIKLGRITAPTVRATVRLTTVLGAHLHHRHVYHRCS